MQWFVNLLEELGIECQVGNPAVIRAAEPRKQKHDRRDAGLILKLLMEDRFPAIWLPSKELQDLRALVRHRHQWVRMRTRIQNALQSIALANGLRRGPALWSQAGQHMIASLPLAPHAAYRRSELQAMYQKFEAEIETEPASGGASVRTSRRTAADDPSRSGAGHGVGDRGISGRSSTIRRQQGSG
jgi:transposase